MKVVNMKLSDLKPYERNPRKNDEAVKYVAKSIQEFGFKVPIVIDKNNVIVAGHTRYKACKKLNLNEVPCVVADDLTDEQIKAFRLADNKVSEKAEWDFELLDLELDDLFDFDMAEFGFEIEDTGDLDIDDTEERYTSKIDVPQYEMKGEKPDIDELVNDKKTKELILDIEKSNIQEDIKEFLIKAAYRHYQFNYSKIAEFYAHQPKSIQSLMEKSALVIIDYDNAIKNGYAELSKKLEKMYYEDRDYEK